MELRMLPTVVPSNGPLLSNHATDDGLAPRALHESSGNGYSWDSGYELQCSEAMKPEFQSHGAGRGFQTTSSSFGQPRSSNQRSRTGSWRSRDPRSKEKEARALFHELSKCEEYQKYRERQPKGLQRQKDQKWPDNLEEAFFLALIFIPPMGRSKEAVRPNDKLQGRNELIADYIQRLTGEPRDRKQVSSHIQVIKPFVKQNPKIMQYFSTRNLSSRNRLQHQSFSSHAGAVPNAVAGSQRSLQELGRESDHGAQHEERRHPKPLEPSGFEMFVQVKRRDEAPPETWRMITKFQSVPRQPDLFLGNIKQWEASFPQLAAMHSKSPLSCHIFSFEASLDIIPDQLPKGAELGITLDYSGGVDNSPSCTFASRTRFFENETALQFVHNGELTDAIIGPVEYDRDDSQILGNVPFGSTFWARKLHELAQNLRSDPGHRLPTPQDDCTDDSKETIASQLQGCSAREHVEAALRRLNAVQEVFAYPRSNPEDVHLVLVSIWHFTKSKSGEQPATTWRRLILPLQPSQHHFHDDLGFASGLLSPQQSFKFPDQWDFNAELMTDINQNFDTSMALPLDEHSAQAQQPLPTLRSPIDLDNHMSLIGLPGYANLQDPLAAMSSLTYPGLTDNNTDDYNYGFAATSNDMADTTSSHVIDPAISAVCSGPSAKPGANTIDFGGGQISLSFDIGESVSSSLQQAHPLAHGALQIFNDPHHGIDASLSMDMGPMEAIADTDIAAPCPVQFTSEQMQEYARRWGEYNGSVYGSTAGYDAFDGINTEHNQADIGAEIADGGSKECETGEENKMTGNAAET